LSILVNNFFLPILGIKIEKYTKMEKKPTKLELKEKGPSIISQNSYGTH